MLENLTYIVASQVVSEVDEYDIDIVFVFISGGPITERHGR